MDADTGIKRRISPFRCIAYGKYIPQAEERCAVVHAGILSIRRRHVESDPDSISFPVAPMPDAHQKTEKRLPSRVRALSVAEAVQSHQLNRETAVVLQRVLRAKIAHRSFHVSMRAHEKGFSGYGGVGAEAVRPVVFSRVQVTFCPHSPFFNIYAVSPRCGRPTETRVEFYLS